MYLVEQKRLVAFSFIFHHCLILSSTPSVAPSNQSWRRDPALDNRMVKADQYNASDHTLVVTASKARCAVACGQQQTCRSFFYGKRSGHCHLHADIFSRDSDTTEEGGVRYYTVVGDEKEEKLCPLSRGYNKDSSSGICYKYYVSAVVHTTAEAVCEADGGSIITLNSAEKVQDMTRILKADNPGAEYFTCCVNARRPQAEWNTPWTENSGFYEWHKTGESLMPLYQEGYFVRDREYFQPEHNCLVFEPYFYEHSIPFTAFMGYGCDDYCSPMCEIV